MMIMLFKMNHCFCKGDKFVDEAIYFTLEHVNEKRHISTKFATKCALKRTMGEMNYNKNLCGITYPSDFIPKIKVNKFNTRIVLTLKVAQTLAPTKTHPEVVLNVDRLDLALNMAIMLFIMLYICLKCLVGYHRCINSNKMSPSNFVGM